MKFKHFQAPVLFSSTFKDAWEPCLTHDENNTRTHARTGFTCHLVFIQLGRRLHLYHSIWAQTVGTVKYKVERKNLSTGHRKRDKTPLSLLHFRKERLSQLLQRQNRQQSRH